jgi:hypothetical protein
MPRLPLLLFPLLLAGKTPAQLQRVASGDFSCHGRREVALIGYTSKEIVVAFFLRGLNRPPEVLRFKARTYDPQNAKLVAENQDADPMKEYNGSYLPGFRPSKSCKGIRLEDGRADESHIYWNHKDRRFDDWNF